MQSREDLRTTIRNILLPHPYYVVRWWIEEREGDYETTLEEAVYWVEESLGSSGEDLKEVIKEVLDEIIQEGETFYKKYERGARNFVRQILANSVRDEKDWAIELGSSPYTRYPEIVQNAVWCVEEWAAASEGMIEKGELTPEESVVYFLGGKLLRDMVEDALDEIEVDVVSERAKEIMENYIEKDVKKLFKELEKGELYICSSEEFREILKSRLLEKDILAEVKEKLDEEGFNFHVIDDKLPQLFEEALDYYLDRKEIKTLISEFVQEYLKQQTLQNLRGISL